MKSWEIEQMAHDEGRNEVNQLNILLAESGRIDDIIKAAKDKEYQKKLFDEFGLQEALSTVQNRLEHTIKNLDNIVENTTAVESQIRDTDMATEMVITQLPK